MLGGAYNATGLFSANNKMEKIANPILIFMGTTYPTSRSFTQTLLADIYPKGSVGEYMYKKDKNNNKEAWLKKWLSLSRKKAIVVGQSLGGSLSLLTALSYPNLIERVNAYAPTGLRTKTIEKYANRITVSDKPKMHVYINKGDLAPLAGGHFPLSCKIHKFITAKKFNPFFCSFKSFFIATKIYSIERDTSRYT